MIFSQRRENIMADSVELNGIRITLVEGYPICVNNVQTWRYRVEFVACPPTPGISNFAFQLCNPQHNVINFTPIEGAEYTPNNAQPCLSNIGATRQMKWNRNNENVVGEYQFSLQGCFQTTQINVAVHAGRICDFGIITGPDCELLPPPNGNSRGIDFSILKESMN